MSEPIADPALPANGIEELLLRAATGEDPADGERFVARLLAGVVGVAGTTTDDGGFQPMVLGNPEPGTPRYVLGFTAPHRLEITRERLGLAAEVEARGRSTRELFADLVAHGLGLLLNFGSGFGKEFTVPEMRDLLTGPGTGRE